MPVNAAYDHPAYLTRVPINMGRTTAGAAGTTGAQIMPWPMRIHGGMAIVNTAGTSTGSGHRVDIMVGTASMGQIALGTATIGASAISTGADMNILAPAGVAIYLRNGTDATGVATVTLDATLDVQASWAG